MTAQPKTAPAPADTIRAAYQETLKVFRLNCNDRAQATRQAKRAYRALQSARIARDQWRARFRAGQERPAFVTVEDLLPLIESEARRTIHDRARYYPKGA